MSEHSELIERLRKYRGGYKHEQDCHEAADHIDELETKLDTIERCLSRIDALAIDDAERGEHSHDNPERVVQRVVAKVRTLQAEDQRLREALMWCLEPPHPIGSNAEYESLVKQWASEALEKAGA